MSNLPRFHCPTALHAGDELELPAGTSRHVQVRRMQPDDVITLFNGEGGEFKATILRMGRSDVAVRIGDKTDTSRELGLRVNLWCGITAKSTPRPKRRPKDIAAQMCRLSKGTRHSACQIIDCINIHSILERPKRASMNFVP